MSKLKTGLIIITSVLLLLSLPGCSSAKTSYKSILPGNTILTQNQIQADAQQLISIVESTHPAFALKTVPAGYTAAKKTFLSDTARSMTVDDFSWLASAYMTSLEDGHTHLFLNEAAALNVSWVADGSNLYLLDENGHLTGRLVTAIGGVSVNQVFQTVAQYFPAENQAGSDANDTADSLNQNVLTLAGIDCSTGHITLTVQDGGQTTTQDVVFASNNSTTAQNTPIITSTTIGDVFYVDLNACEPGTEVDNTVARLKQAVAAGTSKVIIDVRDNGGGNDQVCKNLLSAMGMKAPQFGAYIRYCALARANGVTIFQKLFETKANVSTAKQNPNISLVVLTNANTFSSATSLGIWAQDGKLGKVIGQASGNSPTNYGNAATFQLTNSCLYGQISFTRWTRPDTKADQKTLQPDVVVPVGGDALQVALSYLDK